MGVLFSLPSVNVNLSLNECSFKDRSIVKYSAMYLINMTELFCKYPSYYTVLIVKQFYFLLHFCLC